MVKASPTRSTIPRQSLNLPVHSDRGRDLANGVRAVTAKLKDTAKLRAKTALAPLIDTFADDRPAGTVIRSCTATGARRLGSDVEHQVSIDGGALRFQPLVTPGWGRQGIAYGPFRRTSGLMLAVSITNGHNTSQGGCIPESFAKRIARWLLGPGIDPWPARLIAWARGPRKKGTLRRFRWWLKSTRPFYGLPECQDTIPAFQAVPPLTFRRSLHSLRLRLVDETGQRMVTWKEAERR